MQIYNGKDSSLENTHILTTLRCFLIFISVYETFKSLIMCQTTILSKEYTCIDNT